MIAFTVTSRFTLDSPAPGTIAVGSLVPDQDSARTAAIMRAAGAAQPAPDGSIPASISPIRLAGRLRLPGALPPTVAAAGGARACLPPVAGAVADGPHPLASQIRLARRLALAGLLSLAACGPAGTTEAIDHFCPSPDMPGCRSLTR